MTELPPILTLGTSVGPGPGALALMGLPVHRGGQCGMVDWTTGLGYIEDPVLAWPSEMHLVVRHWTAGRQSHGTIHCRATATVTATATTIRH